MVRYITYVMDLWHFPQLFLQPACSLSGLAQDQQNIWKAKNRLQASVLPCLHLMNSFAENKYAQIVY